MKFDMDALSARVLPVMYKTLEKENGRETGPKAGYWVTDANLIFDAETGSEVLNVVSYTLGKHWLEQMNKVFWRKT